jgi:hypothetical protein
MKSFLKKHRIVTTRCLVVLCLTVLAAGLMIEFPIAQARFEFKSASQDQSATGETIDLLSFRSQKGRSLAEAIKGHSLALIVVVDPNCKTCLTAKDSLRSLRDRVEKSGITYYVLMLPSESDTQKYFAFADSLNLDAESFVWSNANVKPPVSLTTLTAPSHLLVTTEGLVVDKWRGIDKSDSTGENMVNQIASAAVKHLQSRK